MKKNAYLVALCCSLALAACEDKSTPPAPPADNVDVINEDDAECPRSDGQPCK